MALQRLAIGVDERERAHLIAGVLGEVMLPAPVALSVFENADAWLVEALYTERPAADEFAIRIGQLLAIDPPACSVEELAERNWVALSQSRTATRLCRAVHNFREPRTSTTLRAGPMRSWSMRARLLEQPIMRRRMAACWRSTNSCGVAVSRVFLDLGTGSGVLAIALCPGPAKGPHSG